MRIVALSGWKRSGKDTAADYLVSLYEGVRTGFADPLKDMASGKFDVLRTHMDDPNYKESPLLQYPVNPQDAFSKMIADFMKKEFRDKDGKQNLEPGVQLYWTPRALCILEGSMNRSVASDYWVKQAILKIKQSDKDLFVISDMRYKSEMAQLKEAFGDKLVTVRINRFDTSPSEDPSERDLDDAEFDTVIQNKGTLEDLYNAIDFIISE